MPTYNVLAAVVELIDADDEEAAHRILTKRLIAAGFDPYEDAEHPSAFLSDVDAEGNPQ